MIGKGSRAALRAAGAVGAGVLACLLAAAELTSTPAPTARPDTRPNVQPNVRMNAPQSPMPAGRLGRAAEAIAADRSGRLVVAAWETLQGTCGAPFGRACPPPPTPGLTAIGYSTDGGRIWTDGGAPPVTAGVMTSGHAWLDRGGADDQTFFLVSRGRDVAAKERSAGQLGVLVSYRGRFKDGALVWGDPHVFTPGRPADLFRGPSLAAAKDGSGRVYLALTNLLGICGEVGRSAGEVEVFRSADEGKSWEGPAVVGADDTNVTTDPKDPGCGRTGTLQFSPSAAVGPGGEVYVLWTFGPYITNAIGMETRHTLAIRFSRSRNGGRTWSAPRDVAAVNSMRENVPVAYSKDNLNNEFPRLAVAAAGPHRGRLYVTYASAVAPVGARSDAQSLVSSQAYLTFSDDRGKTWSAPAPLAPPVPPTGVKRLWPSVAVRAGGAVDVVYLESQEKQATPAPDDVECKVALTYGDVRTGKVSSLIDIYRVHSADGASFGPPVRVTSATSDWCKVRYDLEGPQFANLGDYIGVFAAGERAFAVWTDGRNGVPDAYFAELAN